MFELIFLIVYLLILLLYFFTSSGFTIILHLFLLVFGLVFSIFIINKITKSRNPVKAKIYFGFILSFLIFSLILFFWFLGDHRTIDDKGLTTAIIIFPTIYFFALISFITGIVLSVKRKKRRDFDYNLKPLFWIIHVLILITVLVFFYNSIIFNFAKLSKSENICDLSIGFSLPTSRFPGDGSYMFKPLSKASCLVEIGITKADEDICKDVCSYFDKSSDVKEMCMYNYMDRCYNWVAVAKKDVNVCIKEHNMGIDAGPYCVNNLAATIGDPSVCEVFEMDSGYFEPRKKGIDTIHYKQPLSVDYCISNIVANWWKRETNQDMDYLCNIIKDNEIKQQCIEETNNPKHLVD